MTFEQIYHTISLGSILAIVGIIVKGIQFIKSSTTHQTNIVNQINNNRKEIERIEKDLLSIKDKMESDKDIILKKIGELSDNTQSRLDKIHELIIGIIQK